MAHSHHGPRPELLDTDQGLRVIKISFAILLATSAAQAVVSFISGSAGLLADTVHSITNTATTLPLWVAFVLGRRKASPRYPYGYHRAEDVAAVIILLFIIASAVLVGFESVNKLLSGERPSFIPLAMAGGAVGFIANEAVAQYRIKAGARIGSAALVADGHHARIDGLGSLAVVLGLAAVLLGWDMGDPIVGLVITALIVYLVVREAAPSVLGRMMDRMEPSMLEELEQAALEVSQVKSVSDVRARWVGHSLLAELTISVDPQLTVEEGHLMAEEVEHSLLHHVDKLQRCLVHVEPYSDGTTPLHEVIGHHFKETASEEEHEH